MIRKGEVPRHLEDHARVFLYLELERRCRTLSDGERHKYFITRRALVEHGLLSMKETEPTEQDAMDWDLLPQYRAFKRAMRNPKKRYVLAR